MSEPTESAKMPRQDAQALELARKAAPAVADEYEAARREMTALADCFARAMLGPEDEALHWARGVGANVCRVARRWSKARVALVDAATPRVVL